MRIPRLHWVPRPLNKRSPFGQRAFPLGPFQTRADSLVLIILRSPHHVRVAKDLIVGPYRRKMMNEANHAIAGKRSKRPTAGLARNDQVAARRDLQIRKSKRLALQRDATVEFFDGRTLTNLNLFHVVSFVLNLSTILWRSRR